MHSSLEAPSHIEITALARQPAATPRDVGSVATVDVSVVIVTWNSQESLDVCLRSIARQRVRCEVIVVDNASSDDTVAMVHRQHPSVRVIVNAQNEGYSRAANQGIHQARGRYTLLLNPDTELRDQSLAIMVHALDEQPAYGAVTGRVYSPHDTRPRVLRRPVHPVTFLLQTSLWRHALLKLPALRRRVFLTEQELEHQRTIHSAHGACILVRTSALHDLQGFDEAFFLYLADTDMCLRLRKHGWQLGHLPEVGVDRVGCGSVDRVYVPVLLDYQQMRLYLFRKHFGVLARAWLLINGLLEVVVLCPYWCARWLFSGCRDRHAWQQIQLNLQSIGLYLHAIWCSDRAHAWMGDSGCDRVSRGHRKSMLVGVTTHIAWIINGVRNKCQEFGAWVMIKIAWYELRHYFSFPTHFLQLSLQMDPDERHDLQWHSVAPYYFLRAVFEQLDIQPQQSVLVDYGCGSGRALVFAAQFPFQHIVGVDWHPRLCELATDNLTRYTQRCGSGMPQWSVIREDARTYDIPEDANLFIFNDPFREHILKVVIDRIVEFVEQHERAVHVVYMSPMFKHRFLEHGFVEVKRAVQRGVEHWVILMREPQGSLGRQEVLA